MSILDTLGFHEKPIQTVFDNVSDVFEENDIPWDAVDVDDVIEYFADHPAEFNWNNPTRSIIDIIFKLTEIELANRGIEVDPEQIYGIYYMPTNY